MSLWKQVETIVHMLLQMDYVQRRSLALFGLASLYREGKEGVARSHLSIVHVSVECWTIQMAVVVQLEGV